jgi:hypothetical protein
MTIFSKRYESQDWFKKAKAYLLARRSTIQQRLQTTFRFVDLSRENCTTFSYEFASILRDSGSVFGSVLDSLTNGTKGNFGIKTDFWDYKKLLLNEDVDIHRRTLQVRPLFPSGMLVPLSALSKPTETPNWWRAYNNVKHSEYENFRDGNLQNAVLSVAALVILEHFVGVSLADGLWVNIGIVYPDTAIDMSEERRLFLD